MLRIREEQMRVLRASLRRRFVESLVQILQQHWPVRSNRLGADALRQFALDTIVMSASHGLDGEQEMVRLANIRMALQTEPPEDIAWMQTILEDSRFRPSDRLDRLSKETNAYLERNYGPWDS